MVMMSVLLRADEFESRDSIAEIETPGQSHFL